MQSRLIHKQILNFAIGVRFDVDTIEVPASCRILSVQIKDDEYCIWYEFKTEDIDKIEIEIIKIATGKEFVDNGYYYLNTVQEKLPMVTYVWHIYARRLPGVFRRE